jgi:hypothetical protein
MLAPGFEYHESPDPSAHVSGAEATNIFHLHIHIIKYLGWHGTAVLKQSKQY